MKYRIHYCIASVVHVERAGEPVVMVMYDGIDRQTGHVATIYEPEWVERDGQHYPAVSSVELAEHFREYVPHKVTEAINNHFRHMFALPEEVRRTYIDAISSFEVEA
jgi:hypothetical protein